MYLDMYVSVDYNKFALFCQMSDPLQIWSGIRLGGSARTRAHAYITYMYYVCTYVYTYI